MRTERTIISHYYHYYIIIIVIIATIIIIIVVVVVVFSLLVLLLLRMGRSSRARARKEFPEAARGLGSKKSLPQLVYIYMYMCIYRSLGVVSDKIASAKRNPVQTGNTTTTPPTTTTTTTNNNNNKGR